MTLSVLSVEAISVEFGRPSGSSKWGSPRASARALNEVSLEIAPGEVVGLIGPNGAGKSTLLRCVLGLQRLHTGCVRVLGRELSKHSRRELARAIAYVPQHKGTTLSLRVIDMVALGRSPHIGLHSAAHDRTVVLEAIERLQLEDLAMRQFGELSGGQRQRVLLARALAQQSQMLLLDEPTSDLDLRYQMAALNAVRQLAEEKAVSALVAIHDLGLAGRFCSRLVLLNEGHLHAQGTWQEVLTPSHLAHVYGVEVRVGTDGGMPYVLTEAATDDIRSFCAPTSIATTGLANVQR